ncbi:tetratricopeptide repeat (TPR)-like superfamily protein [Wolffia australiana]
MAATRVGLCFERARAIDRLRLLLRRHDPSAPLDLPPAIPHSVALPALRSAPSPDHALLFFEALQSASPSPLPAPFLHTLARTLALSGRAADLHSLLSPAAAVSPMDRLRWFSAAGDRAAALAAWAAVQSAAAARRRRPPTESYNLLISLHAAAGSHSAAVQTFHSLLHDGGNPNSRTFTVVIEHLAAAGNVAAAAEVFSRLPSMRVQRTSKQYSVLAAAFAAAGDSAAALNLLQESYADGIPPPGSDLDDDDEDDEMTGGLRPWLDARELAAALEDWDEEEVAALEAARLVWTPGLVRKFLRGFKKATAVWRFFCWASRRLAPDRETVGRMAAILARAGEAALAARLLDKARADGLSLPFATVRLVIDFLGLAGDGGAAAGVYSAAESLAGPLSDAQKRLLCGSAARALAKCKRGGEAMEVVEMAVEEGVVPDAQTFAGLVEFFAGEGDQAGLRKAVAAARRCGVRADGFVGRVLARAHVKAGRAALAMRVVEDMLNSGVAPDEGTKELVVRALWKEGKLREAAYVERRAGEVRGGLPLAVSGHVWTVSTADLLSVYDLYRSSFS